MSPVLLQLARDFVGDEPGPAVACDREVRRERRLEQVFDVVLRDSLDARVRRQRRPQRFRLQRVDRMLSRFFFSSRRRHTRWTGDWSSDVCSSDLPVQHINATDGLFRLETGAAAAGAITCHKLVISAGLSASKLARTITYSNGYQPPEIGRASCREREKI